MANISYSQQSFFFNNININLGIFRKIDRLVKNRIMLLSPLQTKKLAIQEPDNVFCIKYIINFKVLESFSRVATPLVILKSLIRAVPERKVVKHMIQGQTRNIY